MSAMSLIKTQEARTCNEKNLRPETNYILLLQLTT